MFKFIRKILVLFLIISVISFGVCYFIDPHNVFHPLSVRDTGVTVAQNFVKMTYLLANPDKFDAFIIGSSRVGNIHPEKINDERCYNLTCSEGTPHEELDNIKTLINNGVVPKHIYLGVDSLSYTDDYTRHSAIGYLIPYEYAAENPVKFYKKYIDPAYVVDSFLDTTISHDKDNNFSEIFYEYGWNDDYCTKPKFNFDNVEASIGEKNYLDEALDDISQIVSLCKEYGIKLTVFTNPMHAVTYEESVNQNYLEFLLRLAEITPYYNFSGYNDITENNANYLDPSHYNAEIGDLITECICYNKVDARLFEQGFGVLINSENAEEWIKILNNKDKGI